MKVTDSNNKFVWRRDAQMRIPSWGLNRFLEIFTGLHRKIIIAHTNL